MNQISPFLSRGRGFLLVVWPAAGAVVVQAVVPLAFRCFEKIAIRIRAEPTHRVASVSSRAVILSLEDPLPQNDTTFLVVFVRSASC